MERYTDQEVETTVIKSASALSVVGSVLDVIAVLGVATFIFLRANTRPENLSFDLVPNILGCIVVFGIGMLLRGQAMILLTRLDMIKSAVLLEDIRNELAKKG